MDDDRIYCRASLVLVSRPISNKLATGCKYIKCMIKPTAQLCYTLTINFFCHLSLGTWKTRECWKFYVTKTKLPRCEKSNVILHKIEVNELILKGWGLKWTDTSHTGTWAWYYTNIEWWMCGSDFFPLWMVTLYTINKILMYINR